MSRRKWIRAGLILAAALVLLYVAVKSPKEAQLLAHEMDIVTNQESSFCEGDLSIKLSNAGAYPIYYTLDGSIPTLESACYEGSVTLEASEEVNSCVLRACAYREGTGEWGPVFTRTWFYADSLDAVKERFSTYVVCITSDPYNLYDYEYGIMVEGKIRDEYVNSEEYISGKLTQPANFTQQGREWERDAFVEILSPDGERLIAQDAGIRIFGHASRQYYYKSFKLYARGEYGEERFAYPLFPDNMPGEDGQVQDSYSRLVVRAHGFDKSITQFREELFQRLCSQIDGIDTKSVAPASVWLNGSYYNFEWLQEVYDDVYMEENYGTAQEGDSYQKVTLRSDKPLEEEHLSEEELRAQEDYRLVAAYADKDLTEDDVFAELGELIDLDNMLQYYAVETYIANWDWPLNNVKLYRYYSQNRQYGEDRQDGRWRYLYYDMEAGFDIYNEDPEDWLSIKTVMEQSSLFGAVMQRPDMQEKFAGYLKLCMEEYFTEEKVREAVEKLQSERDQELEESLSYKQKIDETYTLDMDEINENIEVIYEFVEERPEMIREQVKNLFGIEI